MDNGSADIVNALLPLLGVGIGAAATVIVQRSSTSAQREQLDRQLASQRGDEIKLEFNDYFEHAHDFSGNSTLASWVNPLLI